MDGGTITCDPDNIENTVDDSVGNVWSGEEEIEFEGLCPVDVSEVSRDDDSEEWDPDELKVVDGSILVETPQNLAVQEMDMPKDDDDDDDDDDEKEEEEEEEVFFPEC
jgi:hypothetical protein